MKKPGVVIPFVLVLLLFFIFYFYWIAFLPAVGSDPSAARGQFGDSFGVLNSLFSGLGFAAVVVTIWMQQEQINNQENERQSLFNLQSCISAYEQAQMLLTDDNNDRETWIHAARLLGHVKVFKEGVSNDTHKRVLEIKQMECRLFFNQLLKNKSGTFFYGSKNCDHSLDAAARASTASEGKSEYKFLTLPRALAEESIYAIWEAAQLPNNYEETIAIKFTLEERKKLILHTPGLKDFLEHREKWRSVSGILHPRDKSHQ